jgi:acyl dehydratase/NADP-dependent 3-hydroxy acid dehydrogenase YdfG
MTSPKQFADHGESEVTETTVSSKVFNEADQVEFAKLSGDYNPMHMDPVAARRTQAGAPVVHGIHMLLWGLDALAAAQPAMTPFTGLKVRFDKMVYVGDRVEAIVIQFDDAGARLELRVNGNSTSQIMASFAPPRAASQMIVETSQPVLPKEPITLTLEDAADRSGNVAFASSAEDVMAKFPSIARVMGTGWVRSILATTTLVGMVCPGLHSIFGGLTLSAPPVNHQAEALAYRVTKTHPKFRVVRMDVVGPGMAASIESFVRHPPTAQASIFDLARLVQPGAFAGTTALVVGGSRGLGELAAKLLSAGGAHVIATYAVGAIEALALTEEIRRWGGKCDVLRYDATKPASAQLRDLPAAPTHLYYFATPVIFRSKAGLYVPERFDEFRRIYVDGFYELFMALRPGAENRLAAFYPSSVAVEERPADMTEYTMAKAAGEVLCADIRSFVPGSHIVINRLPRLPTDQTATLIPTESANPLDVMLPIIHEVQGGGGS